MGYSVIDKRCFFENITLSIWNLSTESIRALLLTLADKVRGFLSVGR